MAEKSFVERPIFRKHYRMASISTSPAPRSAAGLPTGSVKGILSILCAVFLLSLSDALVKLVSDRVGLFQILFLRSSFAMGALVAFAVLSGRLAELSIRAKRWVGLRSLCLCAMWVAYYAALPALDLPIAAAAYYTAPIWMALGGWLCLSQRLNGATWIALGVGFCGACLALKPMPGMVSPSIVLPILAAIAYAAAGLITHQRCAAERPLAMAFHLNASLAIVGGLGLALTSVFSSKISAEPVHQFLRTPWQSLDAMLLATMAGLGLLIAAITILVARAYQSPRPALIGVFDNAYLGFAGLWSFVLFGVVPDGPGLVGIVLIACAGAGAALSMRRQKPDPKRAIT